MYIYRQISHYHLVPTSWRCQRISDISAIMQLPSSLGEGGCIVVESSVSSDNDYERW